VLPRSRFGPAANRAHVLRSRHHRCVDCPNRNDVRHANPLASTPTNPRIRRRHLNRTRTSEIGEAAGAVIADAHAGHYPPPPARPPPGQQPQRPGATPPNPPVAPTQLSGRRQSLCPTDDHDFVAFGVGDPPAILGPVEEPAATIAHTPIVPSLADHRPGR